MNNGITQPIPQAQNTTSQQANQVAKNDGTKTADPVVIAPYKRTMEELLNEVGGLFNHTELWQLTYMVHSNEFFKLKEQQKENFIPVSLNELCASNPPFSKLEYLSRCVAEQKNGFQYHHTSFTFALKNLCSKCGNCTDNIAFCPHKMAAYIEYICSNNGLNTEEVYRIALRDKFVLKPAFASFTELQIPSDEYSFIDAVSATAAAELIKMRFINISSETDDRILYSYLPICEKTTRSLIEPTLNYYRCKSGKNDFIHKNNVSNDIGENRNCSGCLFPQCPDKIAAYFIYLSNKYKVDVMQLAEYVITKNKINGITLRGNFRYYENLRKLDNIPFTPESRSSMNNIIKYVVNKYTQSAKVPFIPFNLAVYTKDEKLADDTVAIFKDVLNYYNYYGNGVLKIEEYKFSEKGITGLLDIINDIKAPTLIHIKELALLASIPETNSRNITMQMTQLINSIDKARNKVCIIISGEKSKLDTALSLYNDFYHGTISYHLTLSDMSTEKIVQVIIDKLKEKYELEEGFETALKYYVISKYGESQLKSKAFIENVVQTVVFNHYNKELNTESKLLVKDIPASTNRRTTEEIWKDLNSLTGLENVKAEIRNIEQLLKFQGKIQSLGMNALGRPNMHMIFAGNPGTGKTTVARLIAEILYNVGFIKQNKLIEVSSKDLIGKYIGHTAPKTAAICESAYGGVLFIDEAYELAVRSDTSSGTTSFRSECISELIKQMEDNRDRLIVIFAGYSEDMQYLIDSNAGFASRIGRTIEFQDYSTEQLTDMFVRMVYKNGLRISEDAKEALVANIVNAKSLPNFGNARYIRNLYENTLMEHAKNMVDIDDPDILIEIQKDDIPFA